MYRYHTHVHTSLASACARNTGIEMVRAYKEKGYTGIFITDHFFNGNTAVQFLRYRSGYVTGDLGRIDAQKLFLNAFAKRISKTNTKITNYI